MGGNAARKRRSHWQIVKSISGERFAKISTPAILKTGLTLDEEQKKQFSERYLDERRKIEAELRKEMDEKRGPRVDAMIDKLKEEFAAPVEVQTEYQEAVGCGVVGS
jgi:hypothetical protein